MKGVSQLRLLSTTSSSCVSTMRSPLLISIEGNIGAGKSTIINYLKKYHNEFNYVEEPLNVWSSIKNDDGKNLLETYYSGNTDIHV